MRGGCGERRGRDRIRSRRVRSAPLVALCVIVASFGLAGFAETSAIASTATWSQMGIFDSRICCAVGGPYPLNTGGGNQTRAISCGSPENCVVVGKSLDDQISGFDGSFTTMWDGQAWSSSTAPPVLSGEGAADLFDVSCGSPTYCAAVGRNGQALVVDVWDGTSWTAVEDDHQAGDGLTQVSCVSATSCVAVGSSGSDTVVQTWGGSQWVTTPSNNLATGAVLSDLSCVSATACTAVGSLSNGTRNETLIETWNGSTWTVVASPNQDTGDNSLTGVSCTPSTACVAVGSYSNGTNDQTLVEEFDGSAWTITSSPNPGVVDHLAAVTCESSSQCVAVGDQFDSFGVQHSLVANWDGTTWTADTSGDRQDGSSFVGVACAGAPSLCIAAGGYVEQSVTQVLVEARNVTAPGSPTAVSAVAADSSAAVHWTAPASSGGLGMSGYTIDAYTGGTYTGISVSTPGTSTSAAIYGLTNGTSYRFAVRASNAVGMSAFSAQSPAIVPLRTIALAAGDTHACVITTPDPLGPSGIVKCWGENRAGDLGDGTTFNRMTPVTVTGLSGVKALALGAVHTCALIADGTVKCWGANGAGQLGDGTTTARLSPVAVPGLSGVKGISAGGATTCAVLTNATMKCWGLNNYGQLGDGTTTNRSSPVTVAGLSQVASTSGSATHRCAVLTTLALKCWGQNNFGQLGDGTTINRFTPKAVASLAGTVQAVLARGGHTCARVTGARVKCWGENSYGQLGDGTTVNRSTPGFVSTLTNVNVIGGGLHHTCAHVTSGAVKCWGRNNFGQLGDGTQQNRAVPVSNPIVSAVSFEGGTTYSAARRSTGGIRTWGENNLGQLGDGMPQGRLTPGPVSGLG